MILAGIDMGIETTKVVIMKDNAVIGRAIGPTGGIDRPENARKVYEKALADAGIAAADVEAVSATGKGKYDIPFAGRKVTETIAAAHAAGYLCPDATSVMSVGADETLVATIGDKRLVGEYALNQKCAAAIGTYMNLIADRLGWPIERMGEVDTENVPQINSICAVFGELDALSLLNDGVAPEAVAGACVSANAVRAAAALRDLTIPANDKILLIGGMTQNKAFVAALEKQLGLKLTVPAEAVYAGAIGAAISGVKGIAK